MHHFKAKCAFWSLFAVVGYCDHCAEDSWLRVNGKKGSYIFISILSAYAFVYNKQSYFRAWRPNSGHLGIIAASHTMIICYDSLRYILAILCKATQEHIYILQNNSSREVFTSWRGKYLRAKRSRTNANVRRMMGR